MRLTMVLLLMCRAPGGNNRSCDRVGHQEVDVTGARVLPFHRYR